MKKIKDLIYDYNDIFLAVIIIAIAGAVIFWKVSDIMAYPSFIKAQQQETSTEESITDVDTTPIEVDPIVEAGDDITSEGSETSENTDDSLGDAPATTTTTTTPSQDTKFTVPSGYVGTKIAAKLESEGLCKADDFIAAMKSLGAENKLRAGDFTIPAGSTAEDIVKIIANIK